MWRRYRDGHRQLEGEDLRAWCRERIAKYKVPRYWKIMEGPFPMTGEPNIWELYYFFFSCWAPHMR